jgi:hypothetical protein
VGDLAEDLPRQLARAGFDALLDLTARASAARLLEDSLGDLRVSCPSAQSASRARASARRLQQPGDSPNSSAVGSGLLSKSGNEATTESVWHLPVPGQTGISDACQAGRVMNQRSHEASRFTPISRNWKRRVEMLFIVGRRYNRHRPAMQRLVGPVALRMLIS